MFRALCLSFVICGVAFMLASCGFTPMYAKQDATSESVNFTLRNVEIDKIPDREGQLLRNKLIDRFYQNGFPDEPQYVLKVSPIVETLKDLDVTITSDTTRAQLKLTSQFALVDLESNKVVLERQLQSINSYNVLGSEFATRVTERSTRDNALEDLARQIERDIALFVKMR